MRNRIAAIAATIIALSGIVGVGFAYAATSARTLVPNSGGQLTGTVYVCVKVADEGVQYVELGHPAPGNCAAGYLQYTANQPAPSSSSSPPPVLVNSESFPATVTVAAGTDTFTVHIPAGSHVVTGSVTAVDLDATIAAPDTVTVKSVDTVTGAVVVAYSEADPAGHSIQVTYDYSFD